MPALASSTATRRSISRENLVNPIVSRPVVKVGGHGFKPQHRGLIEGPGKQPKLELVKSVERPPAVLDGAAPAFDRVFDTLKRDQRVDSAEVRSATAAVCALGASPSATAKSAPGRAAGSARRSRQ